MNLNEVIGKKLTDVYVKYKLRVNGLDYARVWLEIDSNCTINIPWHFNDVNLKNRKSWLSKSLKYSDYFKEIRNTRIVDFLVLDDDEPMSAGFFELDNGKVIYEETCFPSGAMAVGLNILPSTSSIKEIFDMEFIRYSDNRNKQNV